MTRFEGVSLFLGGALHRRGLLRGAAFLQRVSTATALLASCGGGGGVRLGGLANHLEALRGLEMEQIPPVN